MSPISRVQLEIESGSLDELLLIARQAD